MHHAGLDHYDMKRKRMPLAEGEFYWDTVKVLPEDIGVVHCIVGERRFRPQTPGPQFLDRWMYDSAWCGSVIKVVLPNEFDPEDADACEECAEALQEERKRYKRRPRINRGAAVAWESHPDRDPYEGLLEFEEQWIAQKRAQVAADNRDRHQRIREARERRQRGA